LGLSDAQEALEQIHSQIRACRLCPLSRSRRKAVPGEGASNARIMFVGEGPGAEEDRQGRPFVGGAGRVLSEQLRRIGLDRRRVFITNIVKCRPPGNRDPQPTEIDACREYLLSQIALINPTVVCTLGRFAAQALIDPSISITREHGKDRRLSGILYVPIYHPAAALHQPQLAGALENDFQRLHELLQNRPEPPDA
jgi:uracil-DNA glycosylase family 4